MSRKTRLWFFSFMALLAALLPVAGLLVASYKQAEREVRYDLQNASKAIMRRTENVLASTSNSLQLLALNGKGECNEQTIKYMRDTVRFGQYFREIGTVINGYVVCNHIGMFNPPVKITKPEHLKVGQPGKVVVLPPAQTILGGTSLFVNYGPSPGNYVNALIDPAQLTEFADAYPISERNGFFILSPQGDVLAAIGGIQPTELPKVPETARGVFTGNDMIYSVQRSEAFPVVVVTATGDHRLFTQWRNNAIVFAGLAFALGVLLVLTVRRVSDRSTSMGAELERAIARDELQMYYQPVFDMERNKIIGAEALLRWPHPEQGMIPAAIFIPMAEQNKQVYELTQWVMRRVASDLAELYRSHPDLYVGINMYAAFFKDDWILNVTRDAFENQIPFHQLVFEIIERTSIADNDDQSSVLRVMRTLRERGVRLAIDDFGVGYSGLSYLQRYELDYLKIDKAFVDGIESETESSRLVDSIIEIANQQNLTVIAEGVERPAQAHYLAKHGVRFGQGWYYAEPMPAHKYIAFVQENIDSV